MLVLRAVCVHFDFVIEICTEDLFWIFLISLSLNFNRIKSNSERTFIDVCLLLNSIYRTFQIGFGYAQISWRSSFELLQTYYPIGGSKFCIHVWALDHFCQSSSTPMNRFMRLARPLISFSGTPGNLFTGNLEQVKTLRLSEHCHTSWDTLYINVCVCVRLCVRVCMYFYSEKNGEMWYTTHFSDHRTWKK